MVSWRRALEGGHRTGAADDGMARWKDAAEQELFRMHRRRFALLNEQVLLTSQRELRLAAQKRIQAEEEARQNLRSGGGAARFVPLPSHRSIVLLGQLVPCFAWFERISIQVYDQCLLHEASEPEASSALVSELMSLDV